GRVRAHRIDDRRDRTDTVGITLGTAHALQRSAQLLRRYVLVEDAFTFVDSIDVRALPRPLSASSSIRWDFSVQLAPQLLEKRGESRALLCRTSLPDRAFVLLVEIVLDVIPELQIGERRHLSLSK